MAQMRWIRVVGLLALLMSHPVRWAVAADPESSQTVASETTQEVSDWDQEEADDFPSQLKDAMQRFSEVAPDSREARKRAMTALMLATVINDVPTANRLKASLLENHPGSVEAAFLLTTFHDGKSLREFLDTQFLKEVPNVDRAKIAVRVIRLALPRFQKELLEDQGVVLRLAKASLMADDYALCVDCRRTLKQQAGNVAATACDELAEPVQRFQDLQELLLKDDYQVYAAEIRGFQSHLLTLMTDEQRISIPIRCILARNHLRMGELDQALAHLQFLQRTEHDSQIDLQLGLCLAQMSCFDESRSVLNRLIQKNDDSPWRDSAAALLKWIETVDVAMEQHAELLSQVMQAFKDRTIDVCDFEVQWTTPTGDVLTASLLIHFLMNRIEVVVTKNDACLFGYESQPAESRLYVKGEPSIWQVQDMPFLPDFKLSDVRFDATGFHGNTQINTGSTLEGSRKTVRDLLNHPQLTSKAAMSAFMGFYVRSGHFPLPIESNDKNQVLRVMSVDIDRPRFTGLSISVDATYQVQNAKFDTQSYHFDLRKMVFCKWQDYEPSPSRWPDLPTQVLTKNDLPTLFRIASNAFRLITGDQNPSDTAAKPASNDTSKQ